MSENHLAPLLARRAGIETSIKTQMEARDAIDGFVASYEKLRNLKINVEVRIDAIGPETSQERLEIKTAYQSALFCRAKIIEKNRPLTIHELNGFLIEAGHVIGTTRPLATLCGRFRDHREKLCFRYISERKAWWLRDLPEPGIPGLPNSPTGHGGHAG